MESGGIAPGILNLGTRLRWVVSFTPRPLYRRYPLYRRLGEPQSLSGRGGEEKKFLPILKCILKKYEDVKWTDLYQDVPNVVMARWNFELHDSDNIWKNLLIIWLLISQTSLKGLFLSLLIHKC